MSSPFPPPTDAGAAPTPGPPPPGPGAVPPGGPQDSAPGTPLGRLLAQMMTVAQQVAEASPLISDDMAAIKNAIQTANQKLLVAPRPGPTPMENPPV